jgi:hypothetical protein
VSNVGQTLTSAAVAPGIPHSIAGDSDICDTVGLKETGICRIALQYVVYQPFL